MQLNAIQDVVQQDLMDVNEFILKSLESSVPLVNTINAHVNTIQGKRLRPLLLLLCAHACEYKGRAHITLAAAIEFIHTATLLHDDVIDDSSLRRGQKTTNSAWGNSAAVLGGDFLYSRAFQLMVLAKNMDIMRLMADTTNRIAEGEVLQLTHLRNPFTTEASYLNVIRCKTATLFKAATTIAAILSGQAPALTETLGQFGLHLGMAYQLMDDVFDYSPHRLNFFGKTGGDDLAEGKPTLPLIYLLKHGTEENKRLIVDVLKKGDKTHFQEIQNLVESSGAVQYTMDVAKKEAELAAMALHELPSSQYRDAAFQLIQYVINRIQPATTFGV